MEGFYFKLDYVSKCQGKFSVLVDVLEVVEIEVRFLKLVAVDLFVSSI